jgi:hypothetical protein
MKIKFLFFLMLIIVVSLQSFAQNSNPKLEWMPIGQTIKILHQNPKGFQYILQEDTVNALSRNGSKLVLLSNRNSKKQPLANIDSINFGFVMERYKKNKYVIYSSKDTIYYSQLTNQGLKPIRAEKFKLIPGLHLMKFSKDGIPYFVFDDPKKYLNVYRYSGGTFQKIWQSKDTATCGYSNVKLEISQSGVPFIFYVRNLFPEQISKAVNPTVFGYIQSSTLRPINLPDYIRFVAPGNKIGFKLTADEVPYISYMSAPYYPSAAPAYLYVKKYINSKWVDIGNASYAFTSYLYPSLMTFDSEENPIFAFDHSYFRRLLFSITKGKIVDYPAFDFYDDYLKDEKRLHYYSGVNSLQLSSDGYPVFSAKNYSNYDGTDEYKFWKLDMGYPRALQLRSNNLVKATNSAVTAGDVNNDGVPDLFISGYSNGAIISKLYINNGDATFKESAQYFTGVYFGDNAFADVDQDGDLDLLITGYSKIDQANPITILYLNKGDGTFTQSKTSIFQPMGNSSLQFADIDQDYDLDLVMIGKNGSTDYAQVYINSNEGTFTLTQSLSGAYSGSVALADMDQDGDFDLTITGRVQTNNCFSTFAIYKNNGKGNFSINEAASKKFPGIKYGAAVYFDANNDGIADILYSGDNCDRVGSFLSSLNFGPDFSKQSYFVGLSNCTISTNDVDNDGDIDFFISGQSYSTGIDLSANLYLNDGTGHFTRSTTVKFDPVRVDSSAFADFNNDGYNDLIVVGSAANNAATTSLYINGPVKK